MAELLLISGVGLIFIGCYIAWELFGDVIGSCLVWLANLGMRNTRIKDANDESARFSMKLLGSSLLLISIGIGLFMAGVQTLIGKPL